jgi:hypothetical protein
LALFRETYTERDIEAYGEILSAHFLWVTNNQIDTYGFDVEMDITTKMFTGQQGFDGTVFRAITVDQLYPYHVWQDTQPDDEHFGSFPNGQYRDYEVDINFYVSGDNLRYRVQGLVRFYTLLETIGQQDCFRCLGIVDYTQGDKRIDETPLTPRPQKASEQHTWSTIKAIFQ